MAKVLENPSYRAHLSKHGHDMSMIRKFTSSVGQLLPVYYDLLYPGDTVKFSTEMFSRTEEITSPALLRIQQNVEWFFVPLKQIYQFADSVLFGISDFNTNFVTTDEVNSNFPVGNVTPLVYGSVAEGDKTDVATMTNNFRADFVDMFGIPDYYNYCRLLELLGMSYDADKNFDEYTNINHMTNCILAAAYQKIYYDWFRISDREANLPYAYNFDSAINSGVINDSYMPSIWRLHYVPWKRDYFTNTKVAPLISGQDIGMIDTADLTKVNQWLNTTFATYGQPVNVNDLTIAGNQTNNSTSASSGSAISRSLQSSLNTANLRSMFAVEKLSEITRRAAKHYDAQVLAHFGQEVPTGISGECYRLGADSSMIQIEAVTAFASTNGSSPEDSTLLGDLAGKGISAGVGRKKSFTAPCHGVLMAVYYALPDADYRPTGVERINSYTEREDFFIPALENLGMQPIFEYELSLDDSAHSSNVLGWQYRFMESKLKYNVLNGKFNSGIRNWSPAKLDVSFDANRKMKRSFFYVDPRYLDTIMAVAFQPAGSDFPSPYGRDPLIHMFQFHVFKSSVMSPYSLPSL